MTSGLRAASRLLPVAVGLTLAAGAVVATAAPAAASTTTSLTPTSVRFVDSTVPGMSLLPGSNGSLPVGAFAGADGTVHQAKDYLTFNVKALTGHKVTAADLLIREDSVADCTTARDTRLWLTASAAKPTWNKQPAEQLDLGTAAAQSDCPSVSTPLDWNIAAALNAAQQDGRTTITLELRAPADEQTDPRFLRDFDQNATVNLTEESAPAAPNALTMNQFTPCTNKPISVPRRSVFLTATPQSTTEPNQDLTFDYWPVANPDQITERVVPGAFTNDPTTIAIDPTTLTDGATYAWRAHGTVDGLVGPWSKTCEFTADYTAPANAPLVSSPDYPTPGATGGNGGTGIPGTFTFRPNGDTDTARYWYGFGDNPFEFNVLASRIGGPATISFAPNGFGPSTFSVVAQDAAGNNSPVATYAFDVKDNTPVVSCDPTGVQGAPRQCVFSPGASTPSAVVGYSYGFEFGFTEVSVAPNGTATVDVVPRDAGDQTLSVSATLDNGNSTNSTQVTVNATENAPVVTSSATGPVGVDTPVTFTMRAVLPDSVTFNYQFNNGPFTSVPVGPDGTATVTETTSSTPNVDAFLATSTAADGTVSDPGGDQVDVVSDVPIVDSTDFPEFTQGGQVGTPGTFTFSSALPGVTAYTYTLDSADPVTVPAGPDGTAQVSLTPNTTANDLDVSAVYADGHTSAIDDYFFLAFSVAPGGFCEDGPPVGQEFDCLLFPQQPDTVSLTYSFDGGAPVTVPTFDGDIVTITLTEPDHPAVLTMTTTDSNGVQSDPGTIEVDGAGSSVASSAARTAKAPTEG